MAKEMGKMLMGGDGRDGVNGRDGKDIAADLRGTVMKQRRNRCLRRNSRSFYWWQ